MSSFSAIRSQALALGLLLAPLAATAQVNFSSRSITQVRTAAQLASAAAAPSTSAIDGVAVGQGSLVYVIHRDNTASLDETFVVLDAAGATTTGIISASQIRTQTGASGNFILEGGFDVSSVLNVNVIGDLYFIESLTGTDSRLFRVAFQHSAVGSTPITANTSIILESPLVTEILDFKVINSSNLAVVAGEEGAGTIFFDTVNLTTTWQPKISQAQLLTANGSGIEAPAESVAVVKGSGPEAGNVWFYTHDIFEVWNSPTLTVATPTFTKETITGWTSDPVLANRVDLHAFAADEAGNIFGFDEPTNTIRIFDGTAVHTLDLGDVTAAVGVGPTPPAFTVSYPRGISAKQVSATQTDVYLASGDGNYGLVRVRFGSSSVSEWMAY